MIGSPDTTLEHVAVLSKGDIFFYTFCLARKTSPLSEGTKSVNEEPEDWL